MNRVNRLEYIGINTANLDKSTAFYTNFLDFIVCEEPAENSALAGLLGVQSVRSIRLRRGHQTIELSQCTPAGSAYPAGSKSNDSWFQHCALVTDDVSRAAARLAGSNFHPISTGPVTLPGGIVAYKFRDPECHPLELIQFPSPPNATAGGIDHSAISVADADRTIAFYEKIGLEVLARQINHGPAQDALDNLYQVSAEIVALTPHNPAPHVELLVYRTPVGRVLPFQPNDIAAARLVFASQLSAPSLLRDPDGHCIQLIPDNNRIPS